MPGPFHIALGLLVLILVPGLWFQWAGLIRMGKTRRSAAWWIMGAGTSLATSSILVLAGCFLYLVSAGETFSGGVALAGVGAVLGSGLSATGLIVQGRTSPRSENV